MISRTDLTWKQTWGYIEVNGNGLVRCSQKVISHMPFPFLVVILYMCFLAYCVFLLFRLFQVEIYIQFSVSVSFCDIYQCVLQLIEKCYLIVAFDGV